ncbi:hypothetical protein MUO79_06690 [Candidatus Bathyarchaeota archaeon]|nr:hypothetical protein [Candidatus Bathyarchaeota archaeon]
MKRTALALTLILALLVSTLLGLQSNSFVSAAYFADVSIQSPKEFCNENAIPLTVNTQIIYGTTTPVDDKFSAQIQNTTCKYSLDNGEWKDVPFMGVTSRRSQPSINYYYGLVHILNCTYEVLLQDLSEGVHFINVTVKSPDSWGDSSVYFTVNAAVDISVLSPQNKTYDGNSLPLDFTVDQPTSWMGYSLDGQETVTVIGNTTITGISSGLHNITLYAKDPYGKTGASETISFTIAQPFPTTLVIASVVSVAVVSAGLLIYLKKRHR